MHSCASRANALNQNTELLETREGGRERGRPNCAQTVKRRNKCFLLPPTTKPTSSSTIKHPKSDSRSTDELFNFSQSHEL